MLGSGSFGCVVKGVLKGTTVSTSAGLTTLAARDTQPRAVQFGLRPAWIMVDWNTLGLVGPKIRSGR